MTPENKIISEIFPPHSILFLFMTMPAKHFCWYFCSFSLRFKTFKLNFGTSEEIGIDANRKVFHLRIEKLPPSASKYLLNYFFLDLVFLFWVLLLLVGKLVRSKIDFWSVEVFLGGRFESFGGD
jgi:hypothetical protein